MTFKKLILGLMAIAMLAIPAQASAVSKTDPVQWTYPPRSAPSAGYAVTLYNQINGRTMGYEERSFGINLGWPGSKASLQWSFKRQNGTQGKIQDGEKLALYNSKAKQYVKYGERTWGINLVWSKSPVYQWVVKYDATSGNFSLYNTYQGDYVVYGERPFGINLRWLKDVKKTAAQNGAGDKTFSMLMQAQPVTSGYQPFTGVFGGGINGTLRKIQNPTSDVGVKFVKPGKSTADCGNNDAVVYLAPGATMTPDQMKAAFGLAQPSLQQQLRFVACVVSSRAVSSFFLNLGYYKNA
jgi:hypothetical protein